MFQSKKEKKDKKDKKGKKEKDSKEKNNDSNSKQTIRNLLVLDGDTSPNHNWTAYFEDKKTLPDGSIIKVTQCSWLEMDVTLYHDTGCIVNVHPHLRPGQSNPPQPFTIKPDFILMRNQVRGPTPDSDKRNVLYGLMMANIPSINTLTSEYMNLERPLMFGALKEIEKRVGKEKFPLIPQNFYSNHHQMIISPDLPSVVKISHAHRGMGKIRVKEQDDFRDLATVVALHSDYCTAEKFITSDYGIRVQKLGDHYRVYKKIFTGSGWKSQFGGADLQEIPLTEEYKLWADECAKCFGGMDILSVDALHGTDGKDYIIELNGTATGLHQNTVKEDCGFIRDMVHARMSEMFPVQNK